MKNKKSEWKKELAFSCLALSNEHLHLFNEKAVPICILARLFMQNMEVKPADS
jgi:hypothetical protein